MSFPPVATDLEKEIKLLESQNGGVVLQVCPYCPKERIEELKNIGFSWDKTRKVMLRFSLDEYATLEDLIATEAVLCQIHLPPVDKAEFSLRSYTPPSVFASVCKIMQDCDARYDRQRRVWTLGLDRNVRKYLQGVIGSRSEEIVQKKESETKLVAAMENRFDNYQSNYEKRQREWEVLASQDSSFARRDYEYTQRLKLMLKYNDYEVGSDGGINWPDPPVPKGFSRH